MSSQAHITSTTTFLQRITEGLAWRIRAHRRRLASWMGVKPIQWARVVMDRETERLMRTIDYRNANAVEISGEKWHDFGFSSYESWSFPDFDICGEVGRSNCCDVIIAEQVFEHVLQPYRAAKNVFKLLRPGGAFLITTPFMLRIHKFPEDCSRWSETGIKHFLAEAGFSLDQIDAGSWGNRACVRGNFRRWVFYNRWLHSLKNEPDFPVVVWALARKPSK
jgi:SAM-dependent methyltransferase